MPVFPGPFVLLPERGKGKEDMEKTSADLLPYEKFKLFGARNLTDAELLAIAIRTGTSKAKPVELALKVMDSDASPVHGLLALNHLSLSELMEIPGIGEVKAIRLKSIAELSRRMAKESRSGLDFDDAGKVADYFMEDMRHLEEESALLLCLDAKCRLLREEWLFRGGATSVMMSPREIFFKALKHSAISIVLLHNHPSGDPSPSMQDKMMTKRVAEGGQLIGIPLIDHIIIGDLCYFSFAESGFFSE